MIPRIGLVLDRGGGASDAAGGYGNGGAGGGEEKQVARGIFYPKQLADVGLDGVAIRKLLYIFQKKILKT